MLRGIVHNNRMILESLTWQDVRDLSREIVVVIPTGSLEQHGPHLPLFTDTLLVSAVAEAVEQQLPNQVLLTPPLWLGASAHHLAFPGTLTASFEAYIAAIESIIQSLVPHGFYKFYLINGHGGNNEPNGVALRGLKAQNPKLILGHSGYYAFITPEVGQKVLDGPIKEIRHACEAEASLMLHLYPDLVQRDKLRDDGLKADPSLRGIISHFDEITEEGSFGYASLATAGKGKLLFEAALEGVVRELRAVAEGYVLLGV